MSLLRHALTRQGPSGEFVFNYGQHEIDQVDLGTVLDVYYYAWTGGGDIAYIFWIIGRILEEEGSIGALVEKLDEPADRTIEGVMSRLSKHLCSRYSAVFCQDMKRQSISYLVPSPAGKSACKTNLFIKGNEETKKALPEA